METDMKKRRRNGAVSSPCPKCGRNSHVVVTSRVDGVTVRARKCFGRKAHLFYTKEVPVQS
jgi:hypothetical protein